MYFSDFEMTIDRRLHRDDVFVTLETVDKGAEIRKLTVHASGTEPEHEQRSENTEA